MILSKLHRNKLYSSLSIAREDLVSALSVTLPPGTHLAHDFPLCIYPE
jgi:hypothetical protein